MMPTVNDPAFRFATEVFDADGTDKVYDISFAGGYIDPANVVAMSGVEDPETGLLRDHKPHTVLFTDIPAGNRVKASPVPEAGRKIIFMRSTDISKLLVKFTNDKLLTGENLDLNSTQFLMAIQEIMDGLRSANLIVEQQIETVVDLNKIITEVHKQVLELLAAGGIVSVAPRTWAGKWEGDTTDDEMWPLPGADVTGAGFYDTYVNGLGLEPNVDYEIVMGETIADTTILFKTVPAPGSVWFTVLRGYAKPYTGPEPAMKSDLRVKIKDADAAVFNATVESEYALVRCNFAAGTEVRVQPVPAVGNGETKIGDGSYMSFKQVGGPVTLSGVGGVFLDIPDGCVAKTRARGSTISIICDDGDANRWTVSGDLAKE